MEIALLTRLLTDTEIPVRDNKYKPVLFPDVILCVWGMDTVLGLAFACDMVLILPANCGSEEDTVMVVMAWGVGCCIVAVNNNNSIMFQFTIKKYFSKSNIPHTKKIT